MRFTKTTKRKLPVSLDLARRHLRMGDATHDDALIASKLEMAFGYAEDYTGRCIRPRSVVFNVLLNAADGCAPLPIHTSSVTAVSCLGKTVPKDAYVLLSGDYSTQLMLPEPGEYAGQTLQVRAAIGYSKSTQPPAIEAAILFILGTLYDNESDNLVGRTTSRLPLTAEKLLAPWRVTPYGK